MGDLSTFLSRKPTPSIFAELLYTYSAINIETMFAIRLDKPTEDRLARLAHKTGHTKAFYAREAILEYPQTLEDVYLAEERLLANEPTFSAEEVKREQDL